ncbi:MAG: DUF6933 domain-containing protein [Acidimicrobiales bacterium]
MILRCTAKLAALAGRPGSESDSLAPNGDDWYANLVWIDGRKCLLVTHAETLFSVFAPDVRAAQLRPLGPFVVPMIVAELALEGLGADSLGSLDPEAAVIAKTADRSVLGCMNDLAFLCERAAACDGGLAKLDLARLHHLLHRNLNSPRDYVPAIELARERAQES